MQISLASQRDIERHGEVFNVGTGERTEIQDVADLISDYQVMIPERPGEVLHSTANIGKIKETLGWSPSINVMDWLRMDKNKAAYKLKDFGPSIILI